VKSVVKHDLAARVGMEEVQTTRYSKDGGPMPVKRRHKITRVLLRRPLSYDHVVTPVIMDLETGFLDRNGN
jgi:hypothetical protein